LTNRLFFFFSPPPPSPILEIANYRIEQYYDGSLVSSPCVDRKAKVSSGVYLPRSSSALGARMLHNCRHFLAGFLLRLQHITVLRSAAGHPYRSLLGDCQAFDDQSESYFGARQSKQLHQVPKASNFYARRRRRLLLHMSAAVQSFHALDHSIAVGGHRESHVVGGK
jgi:hypothetical protein